jgi:RNA polymerase sigma-70 factor, ECF subfamily
MAGTGQPDRGLRCVKVVMVTAPERPLTYEQFFAEEYPRLVPMLHALTGDRGRAEDLAQDALTRAHREWHRITAYDKPGAWVRRVARNLASNSARRSRREQRALRRVTDAHHVELTVDDERLWTLVRELPDQQRWAVALFYVEDMSVSAVADVLEITEGTVKTHLSRARATLAARLRDVHEEPSSHGR